MWVQVFVLPIVGLLEGLLLMTLGQPGRTRARGGLWSPVLALVALSTIAAPLYGQMKECRPPVTVSRLPRGAVVDTGSVRVRPWLEVAQVRNRKGLWAGTATWFELDSLRGRAFSFAQLESLAALGVVTDSSTFTQVRYVFPIRSASSEEAVRAARNQAPLAPPALVTRELQRRWRLETK